MTAFIAGSSYPCPKLVFVNSSALVCVQVPLPSVVDVLVPIIVGVTAFSPSFFVTSAPLLSFTVTPRVTEVFGCVMVASMATQCHPGDALSIQGFNYSSQAFAFLVGQRRNYSLIMARDWSSTRLNAFLPSAVDAADEAQPVGVAVQVGLSTALLPRALWMVNALTVGDIRGCANQTSTRGVNTSILCVAGMSVDVFGSGFTASSSLTVQQTSGPSFPPEPCVQISLWQLSCRLPRLSDPIPANPLTAIVQSGTANAYRDAAVSYIPTPVYRQLQASSGCTSARNQPLRNCVTGAAVTVSGSNFQPFTAVQLYVGSRADHTPLSCASLRYLTSSSLLCTLPPVATVAPNTWLSLSLNSSLSGVAGPSVFIAEALLYAGDPPAAAAGETRWGLSLDELVIVIVAVVVVVLLLLALQMLWCLSRLAGVRFPRLERLCPGLMAAMRGPHARGEERGGINLGLLQGDQLRFDASQQHVSEGHRTPYVPFAAAAYTAQPSSPPAGAGMPAAGYRAFHLVAPSQYHSHLVPPRAHYEPL